jgi:hypothetical protein
MHFPVDLSKDLLSSLILNNGDTSNFNLSFFAEE